MRILLTGASGYVGGHLLEALKANGHHVTACIHTKSVNADENISIDYMKMQSPEDWLPYLQNIDVVINGVGIIAENKKQSFANLHHKAPASLFQACEQVDIKRVIQISALGADENAIVPYHLSKKAADDALRKADLDWFVLRPSLIYGGGGDSFALFKRLSSMPVILLFDDGQQMLQPVHISDVVASVLCCLDDGIDVRQTIDVVGQAAISYRDWMLQIRGERFKPLFLSVPINAMIKLAHLGKYINLAILNPDSLRMLKQNNVADSVGLTAFLGRKPLSVKDGLEGIE